MRLELGIASPNWTSNQEVTSNEIEFSQGKDKEEVKITEEIKRHPRQGSGLSD